MTQAPGRIENREGKSVPMDTLILGGGDMGSVSPLN
jgi:hypothetical protein